MTILSKFESEHLKKLCEIDWNDWEAVTIATLLFIRKEDQVLMIKKKRGLGKGKFNAAGGKLEKGETLEEGALREMKEELCIDAHSPKYVANLKFQFCDGYSLETHVFLSYDYSGIPQETDEAIPFWFHKDNLPFSQMWEDDQYWVPQILDGQKLEGRFLFREERLLDYFVENKK